MAMLSRLKHIANEKAREEERKRQRPPGAFKDPDNSLAVVTALKRKYNEMQAHFRLTPGVDMNERSPLWGRDAMLDLWIELCDSRWNISPHGYNVSDLLFLVLAYHHVARDVSKSQRLVREAREAGAALRIDLVEMNLRLRRAARTLAWWGWPLSVAPGRDGPVQLTAAATEEIESLFDRCCALLVWGLGTDRSRFLTECQDLRIRKSEMRLLSIEEMGREEVEAQEVIAEADRDKDQKEVTFGGETADEAAARDRKQVIRQQEELLVWRTASSFVQVMARTYFHVWSVNRWLRENTVDQKQAHFDPDELSQAEGALTRWLEGRLNSDLSDTCENRFRELCYLTVLAHGWKRRLASRTHGTSMVIPARETLVGEESVLDIDVVHVDALLRDTRQVDIFKAKPAHPFRECAAINMFTDSLATATDGLRQFNERYMVWHEQLIAFIRRTTGLPAGAATGNSAAWPDDMPVLVRVWNQLALAMPTAKKDGRRALCVFPSVEAALAAWCIVVRRGGQRRKPGRIETGRSIMRFIEEVIGPTATNTMARN